MPNTTVAPDGLGGPRSTSAAPLKAFTATTLVVLAAGLLVVAPAQAAAGDLDISFSGDGTLVTDFGDVTGPDVAIQDDGRIVAVGRRGLRLCAGPLQPRRLARRRPSRATAS